MILSLPVEKSINDTRVVPAAELEGGGSSVDSQCKVVLMFPLQARFSGA